MADEETFLAYAKQVGPIVVISVGRSTAHPTETGATRGRVVEYAAETRASNSPQPIWLLHRNSHFQRLYPAAGQTKGTNVDPALTLPKARTAAHAKFQESNAAGERGGAFSFPVFLQEHKLSMADFDALPTSTERDALIAAYRAYQRRKLQNIDMDTPELVSGADEASSDGESENSTNDKDSATDSLRLPQSSPTPSDQGSANLETRSWMELYFDGGSRGNPGPAGAGAVLYHESKTRQKLLDLWSFLGHSTNNLAEYSGLTIGLQALCNLLEQHALHNLNIRVYGDSKLVLKQVKGHYICKDPALQRKLAEVREYILRLRAMGAQLTFTHRGRRYNGEADRLANVAMDAQTSGETKTTESDQILAALAQRHCYSKSGGDPTI